MKHNTKYKESLLYKPLNKAGYALISSTSTRLPKKSIFNAVLRLFRFLQDFNPWSPQAPLTVTVNLDPDPGFWPNLDPDPGQYYQFERENSK